MHTKGSAGIIIYVTLGIMIIGGLIFVWNLQTRLDTTAIQINKTPVPTQNIDPVKNWKTYINGELGLNLKYPPDWGIYNEITIAQFQRTNIISIRKTVNQLFTGYYNIDLFDKLYSLTPDGKFIPEYFNSNQQIIIQIESGKLKDNSRYVIYKNTGINDQSARQPINAFIRFKDEIIQLTLNRYDDYGLETFKLMVRTATLMTKN